MDGSRARATLGLSSDANAHDVKRAFRARVKAQHPDIGGSSDAFRRLRQAYETALAEAPSLKQHVAASRFLNAADLAVHAPAPLAAVPRPTRSPVRSSPARSFAYELKLAMAHT